MTVTFQTLQNTLKGILLNYGFTQTEATTVSQVFAETTLDGVFSHGINRFPRFIGDVRAGTVVPGIAPELKESLNGFEQWDGRRGAGITNALFCTDRCMELASGLGIACVGLRNTNHWMRGGSYGWKAADRGFLFLGWTNTLPNMPPWGGRVAALGNNPLILAIPRSGGHIVLDMAMSQYSYGKLEWHQRKGTDLPEYGGYNQDNQLTRNPGEILETQRILPAGFWKGSALSLVLDLAAAILSGGYTSRKIGELHTETALSQVFIAVDIERHLGSEQREQLVEETLNRMQELNQQARYPGQRSLIDREKHLEHGMEVPDELWEEILQL